MLAGSQLSAIVAPVEETYREKPFKYSSHYWILKYLGEAGRPLRILDVGTAGGYLGAHLKRGGHFLVGVERDPASAAQARTYYDRVHEVDIEAFDFPYEQEFDFILFADVLEHLKDPEAVLYRALAALRPGGRVIVSVPNVANIVIRLQLLLGRFEYSDRGIADRTHLRFFTLRSLSRMVDDCGLHVVRLFPTPIPVQLVWPSSNKKGFAALHEMHHCLVRFWKTLLAYQFVVCLRP